LHRLVGLGWVGRHLQRISQANQKTRNVFTVIKNDISLAYLNKCFYVSNLQSIRHSSKPDIFATATKVTSEATILKQKRTRTKHWNDVYLPSHLVPKRLPVDAADTAEILPVH
jgi:hypothetical protein